ncbi:aminoglycoside phosphotransferase family protein [Sutcliffiella horikoshii]|uniref:aminoglycoside phosphotransferase family protein n=1 Tax=Sutcliffiella horikoshii TaxID=79883 RepID=UPI001CFF4170|nr:aminoglycoside phosphotransferase family protein [Sutcliffiella horikoshii]
MVNLPQKYIQTIKSIHKEEGETWLRNFDSLIEYCEEKWSLKVLAPFELSYNFVAPAEKKDGHKVVLKLSVPTKEFQSEVEALNFFAGDGMLRILDVEIEKGILILNHLIPGDTLATLENDIEATEIAAGIMKSLWVQETLDSRLPQIEEREQSLIKFLKAHPTGKAPITQDLLQKAIHTFRRLLQEKRKRYILHGDLHHYNILKSESTWVAIDPKGLVGEREYDTIQFLLNNLPDDQIEPILSKRISVLVDKLKLNERRILAWGFAHSILSICWSLEDGEEYSEPFYKSIFAFEKLHNEKFGCLTKQNF